MSAPVICNVYNGETLVGHLTSFADATKTTIFTYDKHYKGPALSGQLPHDGHSITSEDVHPFFRNMISEGWLEGVQRELIEREEVPSYFDLLAYYGSDCIGSLSFIPEKTPPAKTISHIKNLAGRLVNTMHALIPGVHRKYLAIKGEDGQFRLSNRHKTSTHIAKLQSEEQQYQNILHNEQATTAISAALLPDDAHCKMELGYILAPSKRKEEGEFPISPALVIERFDRTPDGEKVEMYEFNQLLGKTSEEKYDGSYGQMADFIRAHATGDVDDGIKTNLADIEILFKRVIATLLVENGDAHLKNFALLRTNDEFRLSPNYDLNCGARYKEYDRDTCVFKSYRGLALSIGPTGKNTLIRILTPKHILNLAKDFGIVSAEPTLQEMTNLIAIVKDIDGNYKKARAFIAGEAPADSPALIELQKTMSQSSTTRQEVEEIFGIVIKRRNDLFATFEVFCASKVKRMNLKAQEPVPTLPDFVREGLSTEARYG